jgi:hypothetical protein
MMRLSVTFDGVRVDRFRVDEFISAIVEVI